MIMADYSIIDCDQTKENQIILDPEFNAFVELHDMSRHAIHSTETLTATISSLRSLRADHQDYWQKTAMNLRCKGREDSSLKFQLRLLESLKLRSEANEKRLQNEVTLVNSS
jgi:hypothetical protein